MGASNKPIHATTPPKGRPTRARSANFRPPRTFGSTAQWVAVAVVLTLAFILLVMATSGGTF